MKTETKSENGRPDPTVQGKDRETAGTESVLKVEKPCIRMHDVAVCISRKGYLCLLHGSGCEPCDRDGNLLQVKTLADCARCLDVSKCDAHITGGTVKQCAPIVNDATMEDLLDIQREDRADRVRADKEDEEPIIDAETCNAALNLRRMANQIEPGFNPREWLAARGL
jgi:hypothetical protein